MAIAPSAMTAADIAAVGGFKTRRKIVSPYGGCYVQSSGFSNGTTATSGTDRIPFTMSTDAKNLQLMLINAQHASGSGVLTATGNALPYVASFEPGASPPIKFPAPSSTGAAISTGGYTGNVIGDGEIVITDPVITNGYLAAGSTQFVRIYKAVSAGGKWPLNYGTGNYGFVSTGSRSTDKVYSTDATGSDQTNQLSPTYSPYTTQVLFGPTCIIGQQVTPAAVTMVTGDSLAGAFGETAGRGAYVRMLENAGVTSFINFGIISTKTTNLAQNMVAAHRVAAEDLVDHIIINVGTNDVTVFNTVTTLAQFQTNLLAVAQSFAQASQFMWFCTMLPHPSATSSPNWSTPAGQTRATTADLVIQCNNWLRDKTSTGALAYFANNLKVGKVAGILDGCVKMETNADGSPVVLDANGQQTLGTGGYFITNGSANGYTADGLHPNAAGYALMATGMDGTPFLKIPYY